MERERRRVNGREDEMKTGGRAESWQRGGGWKMIWREWERDVERERRKGEEKEKMESQG